MASKLASRLANDAPTIKRWGWAPLISQAGRAFGDLAIATIAMNEIAGPIIFKIALDRAKETRAPVPSLADATEEAA